VPQFTVRFQHLAEREYEEARQRYLLAGTRVSQRFRAQFDRALQRIIDNPYLGSPYSKRVRWMRVRKFPYLLYYTMLDEAEVLIVAVAHAHRRPGYWLSRLPS
jgi:plasmid stabilization system protein ParE